MYSLAKPPEMWIIWIDTHANGIWLVSEKLPFFSLTWKFMRLQVANPKMSITFDKLKCCVYKTVHTDSIKCILCVHKTHFYATFYSHTPFGVPKCQNQNKWYYISFGCYSHRSQATLVTPCLTKYLLPISHGAIDFCYFSTVWSLKPLKPPKHIKTSRYCEYEL